MPCLCTECGRPLGDCDETVCTECLLKHLRKLEEDDE
jgi:NMD protein affecting ribosome stability and mRNA decay